MGILNYIPPKKNIIDRRNDNGGYYVAKCECCGTEFYPRKSNAKYCSSNCNLIKHRERKLSGVTDNLPKVSERKENLPKESVTTVKQWDTILKSRSEVVEIFRNADCRTHGLLKLLKGLNVGDETVWEGFRVGKISAAKYGLDSGKMVG